MTDTTNKRPVDGAASDGERKSQQPEPRRDTRRRIRKIAERHRETFDELAD